MNLYYHLICVHFYLLFTVCIVCLCVCVWECVCVYCMCLHIMNVCVYIIWVCVCMWVNVCVRELYECVRVCEMVCVCVYAYMCVSSICVWVCVCVSVCQCVCLSICPPCAWVLGWTCIIRFGDIIFAHWAISPAPTSPFPWAPPSCCLNAPIIC